MFINNINKKIVFVYSVFHIFSDRTLPENISFFSLGISLAIKTAGCNSANALTHSTTARLDAEQRGQKTTEKCNRKYDSSLQHCTSHISTCVNNSL